MKLWLDDVRDPWTWGYLGWHWVKTAEDAISAFKTGEVKRASLDHDLTPEQTLGGTYGTIREDGQKSGYDVIVWLEEHPEFWPEEGVKVHSANPPGAARMQQVINRHEAKTRQ